MVFARKPAVVETADTHAISSNHMRDPALETGVYGYDVEKNEPKERKMSRVGGPVPGIVGDSDADSALSVGKQLELEATNSIKYRTCSWPKVNCRSRPPHPCSSCRLFQRHQSFSLQTSSHRNLLALA